MFRNIFEVFLETQYLDNSNTHFETLFAAILRPQEEAKKHRLNYQHWHSTNSNLRK